MITPPGKPASIKTKSSNNPKSTEIDNKDQTDANKNPIPVQQEVTFRIDLSFSIPSSIDGGNWLKRDTTFQVTTEPKIYLLTKVNFGIWDLIYVDPSNQKIIFFQNTFQDEGDKKASRGFNDNKAIRHISTTKIN